MNEIIELSKMSRRRFFKRNAKKLLYADWLCQILAFVIVGSCYVGIMNFGVNFSSLVYSLTQNTSIYALVQSLYIVFSLFMTLPLLYGVVLFEKGAAEKGNGKLSDLFYAFSSACTLSRSYCLFFSMALRMLLCFCPAIALRLFLYYCYYDGIFFVTIRFGEVDLVSVLLRSIFVLLLGLGFVLSAGHMFTYYVSVQNHEKTLAECRLISRACFFGNKSELSMLAFSFLPLCILSLFTFGILFVMFTLPYMALTFTMYFEYLCQKEKHTKNASAIIYTGNENEEE